MRACVKIIVSSLANKPGRFEARIADGQLLVASSRQPFLDAARAMHADCSDPAIVIVMRHAGSDTDAMRSTVGAAAQLRVEESERIAPRFRPWMPAPAWQGTPPIAQSDEDVPRLSNIERASEGRPTMPYRTTMVSDEP